MKKIVLTIGLGLPILLAAVVFLTVSFGHENNEEYYSQNSFVGFEVHVIQKTEFVTGHIREIIIIVDQETDVMYMVVMDGHPNTAITVMLDESGSPMLWSEYNNGT